MIRTNLATRPFYNIAAVRTAVALFALVVLAITAFNVVQTVRLTASENALGAQAAAAENQARLLRQQAAQIRTQIDPKELDVVAKAAREANAIIDQRTFSWTTLFGYLEATLPADVRITSITPRPADQVVVIGAEARTVEELDAFIEGLEATGAFHDVLPTSEVTTDEGVIEATIEARYRRPLQDVQEQP
jgi:hypothetical protein